MVITTVPDSKTARVLAGSLVEKRLAACVNICENVKSFYRWKAKTRQNREALLVIKTLEKNFKKIEKHLRAFHPYELPELIGLPVRRSSKEYHLWIKKSVL